MLQLADKMRTKTINTETPFTTATWSPLSAIQSAKSANLRTVLNNPRAAEARNCAFFIAVFILVAGAFARLVALARRVF